MKLNQLRAFNELMLVKSVSEAARNLGRTQSSISGTIAGLEADLGMQLFERRSGRLHPVPEAQYLHKECSEILRRLETVNQNIRRITAMESGEIQIASMPGPSVFFLPDFIARHCGDRPDIKSKLVSRSSDAVYSLLAAQQFDLGIADYDATALTETSLIETTVFELQCVCAVPMEDPLAAREEISPIDLDNRPIATLYDEHETHRTVLRAFADAGARVNIRFQTQYFIPLLTFVERGLACAIVDPITARSYQAYRGDSGLVQFKPFTPSIDFKLAMLLPAHRPASHLGKYIASQLAAEFHQMAQDFGTANQ